MQIQPNRRTDAQWLRDEGKLALGSHFDTQLPKLHYRTRLFAFLVALARLATLCLDDGNPGEVGFAITTLLPRFLSALLRWHGCWFHSLLSVSFLAEVNPDTVVGRLNRSPVRSIARVVVSSSRRCVDFLARQSVVVFPSCLQHHPNVMVCASTGRQKSGRSDDAMFILHVNPGFD